MTKPNRFNTTWKRAGGGPDYRPEQGERRGSIHLENTSAMKMQSVESDYLAAARARHEASRRASYFDDEGDDDEDDELLVENTLDQDDPLDAFMNGVHASLGSTHEQKTRPKRLDEEARELEEDMNLAQHKRQKRACDELDNTVEEEDGKPQTKNNKAIILQAKTYPRKTPLPLLNETPEDRRAFRHILVGPTQWLCSRLENMDIHKPTEAQSRAITPALNGHDILLRSATGSGKTLAFLIPMAARLAMEDSAKQGTVSGLVLSPTRELCEQTFRTVHQLVAKRLNVVAILGGAGKWEMGRKLNAGADIVVATPGRLVALANEGHCSLAPSCQFAVIDEVDLMFDLGFHETLRSILEKGVGHQRFVCSATLPIRVQPLIFSALSREHVVVFSSHDDSPESRSASINNNEELVHRVLVVDHEKAKPDRLEALLAERLHDWRKVLVFVTHRNSVETLQRRLQASERNTRFFGLHGDLDASKRTASILEFRKAMQSRVVLIATDLASRGLDIQGLDAVINFDTPSTISTYVHRAGRAGRAGAPGIAISFLNSNTDKPFARELVSYLRASLPETHDSPIDPQLLSLAKPPSDSSRMHQQDRGYGAEIAPPPVLYKPREDLAHRAVGQRGAHLRRFSSSQRGPSLTANESTTSNRDKHNDSAVAKAMAAAKAIGERLRHNAP